MAPPPKVQAAERQSLRAIVNAAKKTAKQAAKQLATSGKVDENWIKRKKGETLKTIKDAGLLSVKNVVPFSTIKDFVGDFKEDECKEDEDCGGFGQCIQEDDGKKRCSAEI